MTDAGIKITKKAALANAGMTQEELAKQLNISRKTANKMLNQKITKTRDLMAFCYACKVDIDNIIN